MGIDNDNRMLYRVVPAQDVREGDILLEPCYDGTCDGPWHEHIVLQQSADEGVQFTTVGDDALFGTWRRRREDLVPILPRSARAVIPSQIDVDMRLRLSRGEL